MADVTPPIVTAAVRAVAAAFAATTNESVLGPVPLVELSVTQAAVLDAVHAQLAPVDNEACPVPPDAPAEAPDKARL